MCVCYSRSTANTVGDSVIVGRAARGDIDASAPPSTTSLIVTLKTLAGWRIAVTIEPNDTVRMLKRKVLDMAGEFQFHTRLFNRYCSNFLVCFLWVHTITK